MADEKKSIFDLIDKFGGYDGSFEDNWVEKDFTPSNVTVTLKNIVFIEKEKVFQIFFSVLSEVKINDVKLWLITTNEEGNDKLALHKKDSYTLQKDVLLTESIKITKEAFDNRQKKTNPLIFKINVTSSSVVNFNLNSPSFEIKTVGIYINEVTEEINEQDSKKNLFVLHFTYRSFNTGHNTVKISIHQSEKSEAFLSKIVDLTDSYETPGKISIYKTVIQDRQKRSTEPFFLKATTDDTLYSFSEPISKFNSVSTEKILENDITSEQLKKVWTNNTAITLSRIEDIVREMNTSYEINNVSIKLYDIFKVDTPLRRAHFFAQAFVESSANLGGAFKGEDLYYSVEKLRSGVPFSTFKNNPENHKTAGTIGGIKNANGKGWKRIPDEKAIANIAYADANRSPKFRIGNTQKGDGWLFRGRGMLQITGRENYTKVNKAINELLPKVVDLSSGKDVFTAKEAVFAGFGIWAQDELHLLADKGSTDADVNAVTAKVNVSTDSYQQRRDAFKRSKVAFNV
jgi:predicted chitinase